MKNELNARTKLTALCVLGAGLLSSSGGAAQEAVSEGDLLDLANGTVILSSSSDYNLTDWSSLSLIDGTQTYGWATRQNEVSNNTITIELATPARIERFVIDTRTVDGAGRAARNFTLLASSVSAGEGFEPLLTEEAPDTALTEFAIAETGIAVRWLRLDVIDNWGASDYTEIMELAAYGETVEGNEAPQRVSGVYRTNYSTMRLSQTGREMRGCYDWDEGTLTGDTDGRLMRFVWRETGDQSGTAVIVLSSDDASLNGLWYEGGELGGVWFGSRISEESSVDCTIDTGNSVTEALDRSGTATLYGIHFDSASAELRAESASALNRLLDALMGAPDLNLLIEGHTDAEGADAYNLTLSARRAETVKAWLISNGVRETRLTTIGKGQTEPVSSNGTPQGRALNRRVVVQVTEPV